MVTLAGIFAWAPVHAQRDRPITHAIVNSGLSEWGVLALLIVLLMTVGMFLDGISIFLIFVPLLMPIANAYGWDPVWFGVILTLKVALGQFTSPLAVNPDGFLPHRARADGVHRGLGGLAAGRHVPGAGGRADFPQLALWLPHRLGY